MKNVYWFCFVLQTITDLGLEATKSYFTVSVDGNFEWAPPGPLPRVCHQDKIKVLSGLPSFLEAEGKNLFLSSSRWLAESNVSWLQNWGLVSSLAVSSGPLLASRDHSPIFIGGPLNHRASNYMLSPSHDWNSSDFSCYCKSDLSFALSWKVFSACKGSYH